MTSEASNFVKNVDSAFIFILVISIALLALITFLMIYFVIKYNRKRHPQAADIEGNLPLEITWTVLPLIIVMGMFYYGYMGYSSMREVPAGAMEIKVTARMWAWSFEYENGKKTDTLYVPVSRPVKLLMISMDVNHSFYVPAFRIKQDVIANQENFLWFNSGETGAYDILCAEYCGLNHAYMLSKVIVMPEAQFTEWYASDKNTLPPSTQLAEKVFIDQMKAEQGSRLMESKGCIACHSRDGAESLGPTFKGIFGKKVAVLTGNTEKEVTVDEEYILRSIKDPAVEITKGYEPIMPPSNGMLTEDEIAAMIEYIKGLK